MAKGTPEQRYWARVVMGPTPDQDDPLVRTSTPCWGWAGTKCRLGYAYFYVGGSGSVKALRWAYERFVGPIPDGLDLKHLCRNSSCVRPDHGEPVTRRENIRRGRLPPRRRTLCQRGHDDWVPNGSGSRLCRTCRRDRERERQRRARRSKGAWQKGSRLCRRGHDNWVVYADGSRRCRTCQRERERLRAPR